MIKSSQILLEFFPLNFQHSWIQRLLLNYKSTGPTSQSPRLEFKVHTWLVFYQKCWNILLNITGLLENMKSLLKSKKGFLSILERMASASLNITASVFLRTMLSVRLHEARLIERESRDRFRPLILNSKQILELDKNYSNIRQFHFIIKDMADRLDHMRAPFDNLSCT